MKLVILRSPGARTPPGVVQILQALALRMPPKWMRVQLVLGDDRLLRRLNRRYRGKDRATDVLSFVYDTQRPRHAAEVHAEIYLSMQRARSQARERRHGLGREVVLLVLHGFLHLQGHDHKSPAEAREMRAAEVPHLRWLTRRWGWPGMQPLVHVPAAASDAVR